MVLRDEQGAEWTLLGTFGGAELAFVCELFADERVPYREEPQRATLGIEHSVLWIAAAEHARAVALLAEAHPSEPDPSAARAVRFVAGGLLAFMLVITIIFVIGERYGKHRPTPGRNGKVCLGPRMTQCR